MSHAPVISRSEHEAIVAKRDKTIAKRDETIAKHEEAIAQRDERISEYERALAEHQRKIASLEEYAHKLRHMIWGRRSEKQPPSPDAPFQSLLFSSEELGFPEPEPEGDGDQDSSEEAPPRNRRRKKRSGKPRFGPNVERKVFDLELPESERKCSGCGETMPSIGYESSERAHHIPAKIVIHEQRRHKYACRCKAGGVTTTPPPPSLFPKSRVTDELRAHVIVSKFVDHCPYYRQARILSRLGYEVSDSSLGRLGIEAADRLAPIIVAMREELLGSTVLQADETTIPVLGTEKAKPGAHRGYLWAYGIPHGSVVYDYTRTRAGRHAEFFLEGYEGVLQTDRYEGYERVRRWEKVIDVACWAHARRRFIEAKQSQGRKTEPVVALIQQLYGVERGARERGLSPAARADHRRQRAGPILAELKNVLLKLDLEVRPQSPLGKAVQYTLTHWEALARYVDHGEAEIDTNLLENTMRPVALGRKNYLFAGSELGAEAAAILYSLTESCRRLGVNPEKYLRAVFRRLATVDPRDGDVIRALTPARWAAESAIPTPQ